MCRVKATGALILLLAGFAVIAVPYMKFMGYIFPEQCIGRLVLLDSMAGCDLDPTNVSTKYFASLVPATLAKGIGKLSDNICKILSAVVVFDHGKQAYA